MMKYSQKNFVQLKYENNFEAIFLKFEISINFLSYKITINLKKI
jgi:hypothetical protein